MNITTVFNNSYYVYTYLILNFILKQISVILKVKSFIKFIKQIFGLNLYEKKLTNKDWA